MALITQRLTCSLTESATFYFDEEVVGSIVGISRFSLTFGNTDHEILQVRLALQVTLEGNVITVTPQATMEDASGNHANRSESSVTIVILAWTGSVPSAV